MKKYFKNLFAIIKILLKIKVNKGADLREGNDAPAEENNDHQREFSGQGFLLYELQGIFPADQNSTDHKQQNKQDQVGSVQQGRLEQIDRLFDQVKLRDIELSCNLCQISGRTEGEKITEHSKGICHAVAAEKEQGQIEKGKGEENTKPFWNIKSGFFFFVAASDTDQMQIVKYHKKSLHGTPCHIGPVGAMPQTA